VAKKVEKMMESKGARAIAKYIRVSPRKMRIVVDLIRGKEVEEAINMLKFCTMSAAKDVAKVINSAKSNAETNMGIDGSLYISETYVDEGPTLKRFRPRAMGRASRINKRTSHVTVVVRKQEEEIKRGSKG